MKFIFFISINLLLLSCTSFVGLSSCGEKLINEVVSPDRNYTAALFDLNCGATTRLVPHINLRRTEEEFKVNNLGIIKENLIPTPETRFNLVLIWENDKTLKVKCPTCENMKNTNWKDTKIIYSK